MKCIVVRISVSHTRKGFTCNWTCCYACLCDVFAWCFLAYSNAKGVSVQALLRMNCIVVCISVSHTRKGFTCNWTCCSACLCDAFALFFPAYSVCLRSNNISLFGEMMFLLTDSLASHKPISKPSRWTGQFGSTLDSFVACLLQTLKPFETRIHP